MFVFTCTDVIRQVVACDDIDCYDKNGKFGKKKPVTLLDAKKKVGEVTMVADLANACKLEVTVLLLFSSALLWYILSAKFSNVSGADWFSVFSDDAENIIGCSADELEKMKSQLTKASWAPKLP
ncbi:Nucleic acid-binding, OB-fold [Artemisia annua]|uniref:Nucleic acid-binding, OB-fold n=1 Tax=Artemisia annua TaxID=35608 RepID=A0A2U1NUD7_ARTAN|nr:Nucleic acid-binding, OB-fold [Artemisia annua]